MGNFYLHKNPSNSQYGWDKNMGLNEMFRKLKMWPYLLVFAGILLFGKASAQSYTLTFEVEPVSGFPDSGNEIHIGEYFVSTGIGALGYSGPDPDGFGIIQTHNLSSHPGYINIDGIALVIITPTDQTVFYMTPDSGPFTDDCKTFSGVFPNSYIYTSNDYEIRFTWTLEPVLSFEAGTSTSGTGNPYCEDENITLVATPGFSGYNWQYQVGTSGWSGFTPPGSGNSRTFGISDIPENKADILTESIAFRYSVGNCDYSVAPATGIYVFNPNAPEVTATSITPVSCLGGNDAIINITATSRTPFPNETFRYQLYRATGPSIYDDTGTTITATDITDGGGLPAGNYKLLVISYIGASATGCGTPSYYNFSITEPSTALSIGTPPKTNETCMSSNDGTITVAASGGWGGYTYSKNSTTTYQASNVFTGLAAGTYTIRVKDSGGCVKSASVTISQPSAELSIGTPNKTNETCMSANDGTITVAASGGWGSYTYSKNSTTTYQASNIFTGLAAGTYTIRVKDSGGCVKSASVTISQPSAELSIGTPNKTNETCMSADDGTITVAASGGWGSYTYSKNSTTTYQASNVYTGLAAGTYIIRVKDSGGCVKSASVTINQPAAELNIGSPTVVQTCFGESVGSITVNPSGGWGTNMYSLNSTTTYQASNVFNGLAAGTYTVRVKDSGGCIKSTSVSISEPAQAVSFTYFKTDVDCKGANSGMITLSANGGWANYQYSKDNGVTYQTSNIFDNLISGTYQIMVKDGEGCSTTAQSVSISEPATSLSFSTTKTQVSCVGDVNGSITITANGGGGGYEYSIDNGNTFQINSSFTGLNPGLYEVLIKDLNGCIPSKQDVVISEPSVVLSLSESHTDVICKGDANGVISLSGSGGWGNYEYSIDNGATFQTSGLFTNLLPGTFFIIAKDDEGCTTAPFGLTVTEPTATLQLSSTINDVRCNGGNDGSIIGSASGGWDNYEYSINGTDWQTSDTFSGLSHGDYILYVRDTYGCSSQIDVALSEPLLLTSTITSEQDSNCGAEVGGATSEVSGGVTPYTFVWRNASNAIVSTNQNLTNAGAGIYSLTVTDSNGCTSIVFATVSSIDGPQITVSDIQPTLCSDGSDGSATLNITGSGPFDVAWENGETGIIASNLQAGNNLVTITDANGCVVVETITITSPDPIDLTNISTTTPSCFDSNDGAISVGAIGGSGSYTYLWSDGTTGGQLNGVTQGIYTVTITDANGCVSVNDVILTGVEPLSVSVLSNISPTCTGFTDGALEVVAEGGNGNYSYSWSNGETGTTISGLGAGTYELTVTDNKGCTFTQSIEVADPDPFVIDPFEDQIEICSGSSYLASFELPEATYSWTSDVGLTSSSNEVLVSEPGNYQLTVVNTLGCTAQDGFELILSDDLLNADFLMISEAYTGDTIIVIDISWPIPENLNWSLPDNATVVEQNTDYALLLFNDPGTYLVEMSVNLAGCNAYYSQSITILDSSEKGGENGRLAEEDEELIKAFDVYPNPTFGDFTIHIELASEIDARVVMVDLYGNYIVLDELLNGQTEYNLEVNEHNLKAGLYALTIQVGDQTKAVRVMIK